MLAAKVEEKNEYRKKGDVVLTAEILAKKYKLTFPLIAESKYDGNRLVSFIEDENVTYNSRSGKESKHLIGLFDDELSLLEKEIGEPIVIDGEVLADSFQQTMNAKGSKEVEAKAALKFYAFDYMTKREWDAKDCKVPQHERSAKLEALISKLGLTKIIKSKSKVISNFKELQDFFIEVIEDGHDEEGNLNGLGEGLILKKWDGLYEWDRSKNWLKWKPIIDLDLKIVGYEMGKGRLALTVGKLLLQGYDENGTLIEARCGSGLNDKMRKFFLENQNEMLGATVMIECQEISLAKNAEAHSARFPIFKKIRDDL
jgi:DNA ligase-1